MNEASAFSRREWLGRVSARTLVASIGAGVLSSSSVAAGMVGAGAVSSAAGAAVYNIREFGAKGDERIRSRLAIH